MVGLAVGLIVVACGSPRSDGEFGLSSTPSIPSADRGIDIDRTPPPDRLEQVEAGPGGRGPLVFDPDIDDTGNSVAFDDPSLWSSEPASDPPASDQPVSGGTAPATVAPISAPADPSFPTYGHLGLPERSHVATVVGDGVASTAAPGDGHELFWFPNPTQFGGDRVFLVLDQTSSPDHVKVSLPLKPNGQVGWIPREAVVISEVEHKAVVDLADNSLTVWRGGDVIVQTKVVTGKRATPTPVGRFYVRDIITHSNPGGAYGPYILALSGFSEALETFNGGLPAIAIHGTNNPGLIGQKRSNGCIRIPNRLVTLLADSVPLGTPVTIVT